MHPAIPSALSTLVLLIVVLPSPASGQPRAGDPLEPPPAQRASASGPPLHRLDISVGLTNLDLRKEPRDTQVGGSPQGVFVRGGIAWTRHLVTEFERATQVGSWGHSPIRLADIVTPTSSGVRWTQVNLKHEYKLHRYTLAQLVQGGFPGRWFIGLGVGTETQRMTSTRRLVVYSEPPDFDALPLSPAGSSADDFPIDYPEPLISRRTVGFIEAGIKLMVGQRGYLLVDGKFRHTGKTLISVGFGVELF